MYVVNLEFGFFGVVLGINWKLNFNVMCIIVVGNMVFINVVFIDDGDVWWEGLEGDL